MANKFDLELAIDAYRAQNGKESEISLFGDSFSGFEYGSNRFSSREQAIWWLKQQKPNHDEIQKMIAKERKDYPNSGLNPLFEIYERYYKQVQQVQQNTSSQLEQQKIIEDASLRGKEFLAKDIIRSLNSDGNIDLSLQGILLPKDSVATLTGRKKVINGKELVEYSKVSAGEKTHNGTGWVYLSDLLENLKQKPETAKSQKDAPQKKSKPKTTDYRDQTLLSPDGSEISKRPKTSENSPVAESADSIFTKKQSIIFKDGAYYLTGPKGASKRIDAESLLLKLNISKEAPENLKKSVGIVQDFALLLDAYLLKNPGKKEQHEKAIQEVSRLFSSSEIQSGKKILDVTAITPALFSNNNFLKNSDLYVINEALRIQDAQKRHLAVLQFIRDRLDQSDMVAQKLMQENQKEFGFPADEVLLRNGDLSATGLGAEARKKISEAIDRARSDANANWIKNKEQYIQAFQVNHPGKKLDEDDARVWNEKLTILMMAKREIVYQTLYNKAQTSEELKLLQDILGAGTWKMSDKSWDISKEVGGMIAMEALAIAAGVVTAGTATVAINSAMFARNGLRAAEIARAYSSASKVKQISTTSARILGSGVGFEFGAASTRGLLENGDWKSMHSKEGYVQSIAMMGVMSGIGKLVTSGKLGQGIQFKEGAGFAKNILPFTGQVAIEGAAIFGTSATIGSVVFDHRDNWTLEQMAQAMLMATMFKGAGRILAKKTPKGEVEITQEAPKSISQEAPVKKISLDNMYEVEIYYDKGTSYFRIKDTTTGKFLQEKYSDTIKLEDFANRNGIVLPPDFYNQLLIIHESPLRVVQGATPNSVKSIKEGRTKTVSDELIVQNQSLDDAARLKKASERLGRKFSQEEKNALLAAHNAETVMQKGRILARKSQTPEAGESGFSKEETRILMEEGYAGRRQGLAPGVSNHQSVSSEQPRHKEAKHEKHEEQHDDAHSDKKDKPKYEWKWKNIDVVLQGDNRKFRQIFPFAENNVWSGMGKLYNKELHILRAIQNSAAWIQNQTFSQIYIEMSKPWRTHPQKFIQNAGDNIRTLLLSGESGKWMSGDRLGKLGIVVSASTIDYITSDEYRKNSDGLLKAVSDGTWYAFGKYVFNPSETVKLYQEILLLNWVAITVKEASSFVGAGTGISKATIDEVTDRLK